MQAKCQCHWHLSNTSLSNHPISERISTCAMGLPSHHLPPESVLGSLSPNHHPPQSRFGEGAVGGSSTVQIKILALIGRLRSPALDTRDHRHIFSICCHWKCVTCKHCQREKTVHFSVGFTSEFLTQGIVWGRNRLLKQVPTRRSHSHKLIYAHKFVEKQNVNPL